MANPAKYVWLDQGLKDAAQSGVPIVNAGLHYGFSVFEGIRCYATADGPAVFRLEEHVDRLLDSALIVGFRDLPWTRDSLIEAIYKTISANKFAACYIRPLIYLDGAMNLVVDSGRPRLIIAVWEWTAFLGAEAKELAIRANIASFTRLHPNIMMTKAKVSGNYVSSILAKTESQRAGFDEAIMLDPQGYVAECTGENIFLVRNNVIYTPARGAILEGITRDSLLALARDLWHTVVEEPMARDQLYIANEGFVCGTAAEMFYPRYGNPTHTVAEKAIAELEGTDAALLFASGMNAITTSILALLKSGDHIVAQRDIYGGATKFLSQWLPRLGVEATLVDTIEYDQHARAIQPNTKLLYLESPTNPTLRVVDLKKVAALARQHNLITFIDS